MNKLTWSTKRIKLGDLKEWDKNPVSISERDAKELAKSLAKFDHVLPYIAAAPKNGHGLPLLDGHQRKMVELQLNKVSPDTLVDVRVPSRKLTERERKEILIRLRKNTGSFDFDKLANFFDVPDLLEWGFREYELQLQGFETGEAQDPEKEWEGMPEFENGDPKAFRSFAIHFEKEKDLLEFIKLNKMEITEKTKSLWFPFRKNKKYDEVFK